ncbi:MAG: DUF3300 domain-containing protein [Burkholderiales bacterium]|nr:DUF3300 domain-containing protein [Burkholderiales bacterium]
MRAAGGLRACGAPLLAALLAVLSAPPGFAQTPSAAAAAPAAAAPAADDPEALVARIALYPDDLIAIILPASTNPLQIVQADRFLAKRKTDPKTPIDDKWDDSVKSLVNYPEVVTMMSADLDWTAALGEAVVADQGAVLEGVQAFRRKTQSAGNLKSDPKQTIVVEKEVIKIVPADPQVIYVPQYNPTTVVVTGGYSTWGYYPSPYPVYYYPYPPGAAFATGLIWGAAIGAAWHGNHYAAHYGGNANININRNTNINTGNINTGNIGSGNRATQNNVSSTQWTSNKQKGQVSKSVGATPPSRVGDAGGNRGGAGASAGTMDRGGGSRGGATASTSSMDRGGASRGSGGGGSAFEGYGSGRSSQMDSSRGAASRNSASTSTRQAPSRSASPSATRSGGGAARGGGGGRR